MSDLAQLERARVALASARTLADFVQVHHLAEGIETSLRARANDAAEIRLLAVHKAGEILAQMQKSKGGDPSVAAASVAGASEYRRALKTTGIPERTARYWKQVAAIPIETVQRYIDARKEDPGGEVMSVAGLLRDAHWFVDHGDSDFADLTEEEREAAKRFADEHIHDAPHTYPPSPADRRKVTPDVLEEAVALVKAGYSARAYKNHPDRGGDAAAMTRTNLAVAFLRNAIEDGKAA